MVKVKFDKQKKKWIELPLNSKDGIYLDGFLKKKLDNVKMIVSKGWDAVILIDGFERSGKSTLGMTIGYYLSDTNLGIHNFAAGTIDTPEKIKNSKNGEVIFVDESSLVFNSRDSMKKANVRLGKILDVVGQKGLIFILVLPSFLNLVKDIAIRRSRFLLRVHADKQTLQRGGFAYFGEVSKAVLYHKGKKNFGGYVGVKADFSGRFVDFKPDFYKEYLVLKNKSLMEALDFDRPTDPEDIELNERKRLIYVFHQNNPEMTFTDIGKCFNISRTTCARYIKELKEKEEEQRNLEISPHTHTRVL